MRSCAMTGPSDKGGFVQVRSKRLLTKRKCNEQQIYVSRDKRKVMIIDRKQKI